MSAEVRDSEAIELPTAKGQVLDWLRKAILSGRLAPGSHVPVEPISERLGVSHQPVREALRVLEGQAQVRHEPRRGYFVASLDLADLVEIYRLRQLLETEAVRVGLPKIDGEALTQLEFQLRRMSELGTEQLSELTSTNRAFHFILLEAAEMPHLQRHIRLLWDATDPYRARYYLDDENLERVDAEHHRILDAIRDGDVDRVIEQLDQHRQHAIESLTQMVNERSAADGEQP